MLISSDRAPCDEETVFPHVPGAAASMAISNPGMAVILFMTLLSIRFRLRTRPVAAVFSLGPIVVVHGLKHCAQSIHGAVPVL